LTRFYKSGFELDALLTVNALDSVALDIVIEPELLLARFYKSGFELDALLTVNAVLQSRNHVALFALIEPDCS
jgi:hypothetical protein